MATRHRISSEVKEQIIRRIKDDGVSVSDAAQEHGIHEATIYKWFRGEVSSQPTLRELTKLQKENKMLMELVGELTVKLSCAQKKS
ncbi:MAG: transposase [Patescibacteria group bacterium]